MVDKEFKNLSKEMRTDRYKQNWFTDESVKEFIKGRTEKLKIIEQRLMSNRQEDWDVALARVRALINDDDKLAGNKLK